MKWKIVALWVISCLAVSSAKAQFNTVSNNACRYKIRKVEEKHPFSADSSVDSIIQNLPQQKTDSVDNKQKQWIRVNDEIELMDTPGVLWPKFENNEVALNLAVTGTIKDTILELTEVAYNLTKF